MHTSIVYINSIDIDRSIDSLPRIDFTDSIIEFKLVSNFGNNQKQMKKPN